MRFTRGGRLFCYLILALLLSPSAGGFRGRYMKCDPFKLERQCTDHESCVQDWTKPTEGFCECERGFKYDDHHLCVPAAPSVVDDSTSVAPDVDDSSAGGGGGGSSLAAGLLIPTFVASAILLFFCARRYQWLQRLRQYRNRYGNVLVTRDDDDDDVPPIP